ncbi:MAG: hypothetical protein KA020_16020, partial [Planctomycetes bacterium]|nr:hypothetical protein [Planctomycetota bacterium]
ETQPVVTRSIRSGAVEFAPIALHLAVEQCIALGERSTEHNLRTGERRAVGAQYEPVQPLVGK